MKLRKWILFALAASGIAAYVQKRKQLATPTEEGIWKPVDPLRPFGERESENPHHSDTTDHSE